MFFPWNNKDRHTNKISKEAGFFDVEAGEKERPSKLHEVKRPLKEATLRAVQGLRLCNKSRGAAGWGGQGSVSLLRTSVTGLSAASFGVIHDLH